MKHRTIGDAQVTAIGVGDVDLAIAAARGVAASDVERALHDALERGITLVEVTDNDDSERLCGDAIRALRLRDRAIVSTRLRPLAELPGRTRDVLPERLPARYVQDRVEAALRTTRLDALPLVQLPLRMAWVTSSAWLELVGTCARLAREGKALRFAARLDLAAADREGRLEEELAGAAALGDPFVALSVVYNACDRRAAPLVRAYTEWLSESAATAVDETRDAGDANRHAANRSAADANRDEPRATGQSSLLVAPPADLLAAVLAAGPSNPMAVVIAREIGAGGDAAPAPAARPKALPVLAREPLAGGTLAGTFGPGVKLSPRDDRNALDPTTLERIAIAIARLAPCVRMQPPAATSCDPARAVLESAPKLEREAATVAELALRYLVDGNAIALPRLHRRERLDETLAILAAPPLSPELVERIERALA